MKDNILDKLEQQSKYQEAKILDGICHCPVNEIEYLITVENDQAINLKTGKCMRCGGTRKSKITGKILTGKRRYK